MSLSKIKILVVDDEPLTLELIQYSLEACGKFSVTTRPRCHEALKLLTRFPDSFDIILSDWNVPGLSGLDFLRCVKQIAPELPFIMVTGNSDKAQVIEAIAEGINGYVVKPFRQQSLLEQVGDVWCRHRYTEQI